jgi:hypothetical protein
MQVIIETLQVVWENSFFHWITAIAFISAFVVESIDVYKYWQKAFRIPNLLIHYLKTEISGGNGREALSERDRSLPTQYLKMEQGKPSQQDGKFILIQTPSVLYRSVPRSAMRFAPTILTALGVLGTFYGIQVGLEDISVNPSDVQEVLASSTSLFDGMKTAFSTSLMGLGSSSLFTLFLWIGEQLRLAQRNRLRKELEFLTQLQTPEQIFSRLDFGDATSAMVDAASQLQGLNPEAMGTAIGGQVGTALQSVINQQLTPVFQEISESLKYLKAIKEDQGQTVLENMLTSLRIEVLEPISDRLDKSAYTTQQASEAVLKLHQELGGISQSLGQSVGTIQQFQAETLGELQKFSSNLSQTLTQFQTDTKDVLQQTAQEVRHSTIEILQQAEISFEKQSHSLTIVGQEASGLIVSAKENLLTSLSSVEEVMTNTQRATQEILQQATQQMGRSITAIIQQAEDSFAEQSQTLVVVGREASGLMTSAKENLLASLNEIDDSLKNTQRMTQDELQKFRQNYQEALDLFFREQNGLLNDTLGQQRQGLTQVVSNLNQAFLDDIERRKNLGMEIEKSMETVKSTAESISRMAITFGFTDQARFQQIQLMAQELSSQIQQMETHHSKVLDQWKNQMEGYMQQSNQHQNKFFQSADTAMAKVCDRLFETAEILVDAKKAS